MTEGGPRATSRATPAPSALYRSQKWYACRTRSRSERKVDRLLTHTGVASYVPLIVEERQWSDRTKKVETPLFPGYVFACFRLTELLDVQRTPGVVDIVRVNGYPTPIRESELDSVRLLVERANQSGTELQPHDRLVRGQKVRVVAGPFQGLHGVLTEDRGSSRIVMQLSAIRQAVSVEMKRQFVWPIE